MSFENDDAVDWLDGLNGGRAEVVRAALTSPGEGYLEAPEGSVAIAAAEITSPPREALEVICRRMLKRGSLF